MREPMAEPPTDPEWRQERVRDSAGHDDRYNGPLGIFEQMDDGDEDEDYRLTSDGGPDDYGMVTCTCFGGLCPANGTCPDGRYAVACEAADDREAQRIADSAAEGW